MALIEPRTIPNIITVGRIAMAPAVFFLILAEGFLPRILGFLLFLGAAFSDLWDGHLARKHNWVSDFGKLMDPIADKLLLLATFIPFYILSHQPGVEGDLPYWGELPAWVLIVIFGREVLVTIVRQIAARRGRVIPAASVGKYKAVVQSVFSGSALLWYALIAGVEREESRSGLWEVWWTWIHGPVLALSLLLAIILTVYSMLVYFWRWRRPEAA